MKPVQRTARAPLRRKVPERAPRALSDDDFDDFFSAQRSDRDRAIVARTDIHALADVTSITACFYLSDHQAGFRR